jgi:cytochrome c biogenesis protein CcmG/thiol:disulfide interchange protein DsbE
VLNRPLPAFSLPSLADPGRQLNPASLRGPAVINFWASWCLACRDENPELLWLRGQGVTVYGVDYLDQREEALRWLEREGSPFADVVFDGEGQLGRDMGLSGTPETYVIDRAGAVRYRRIGQVDAAGVEQLLQQVRRLPAN